jgi:hypothetical protein
LTTSRDRVDHELRVRLLHGVAGVDNELHRTWAEHQPALLLGGVAPLCPAFRARCRFPDRLGGGVVGDDRHGDVPDPPAGVPGVLLHLQEIALLDVRRVVGIGVLDELARRIPARSRDVDEHATAARILVRIGHSTSVIVSCEPDRPSSLTNTPRAFA